MDSRNFELNSSAADFVNSGPAVRIRLSAPDFEYSSPSSPSSRAEASGSTFLAHRFLHERADPCLLGGGQLRQREGDRPHGAFVEVRRVVEAERRAPRLELLRGLEEADVFFVLSIRGHAVPEFRREDWRAGLDDGMEPL